VVALTVQTFLPTYSAIVDPRSLTIRVRRLRKAITYIPKSFALARTVEYFRIPRNVMTICLGKDYARCGIIVNVTRSSLSGGLCNAGILKRLYAREDRANEGSPRCSFSKYEVCEVSYKDRGGNYQGQQGVTPPKL
jgi:dCTP deaminase